VDASEAADVDCRQVFRRRLDRVAFVMYLEDLGPTGRRAAGRLERWRVERFAEMEQDLPDRGRVGDERDEPDVATAGRAREKLLSPAAMAIFTLAKIKGATQAFDKGQTNVFDALDTIVVEIEAYRSGAVARRKAAERDDEGTRGTDPPSFNGTASRE
jgi:hypothetical protein